MSSGNWLNADGLYLEFGTTKSTVQDVGEYTGHDGRSVVEIGLDLTTLTTTPTIISQTLFFPPAGGTSGANSNVWIIERVTLNVDTAVTGSSGLLRVGLIQDDRATTPTNYAQAFINSETIANMATVGDALLYVGADSIPAGSGQRGILIGTTPAAATGPYYITANLTSGTFTAGKVRIRIFYRAITGATITK